MRKVYAGIDLGGTFIKAGLLTSQGERITSFKIPTEAERGHRKVAENLVRAGQKLVAYVTKNRLELAGIGAGSPGTIKYPQGIVTGSSPNINGWIGTNISGLFKDFDVEVKCDNDANCMAWGEFCFGAAVGTESGFFLTIGTGIGGAIIQDKKLQRGSSYAAGEFGHTVFRYNGIKCKCGRRGCVEAYTAVPALIRSTRKIVQKTSSSSLRKNLDDLSPEMIFDAFKKGDKAARESIKENTEMLGEAIGSAVNLLNPDIVVIGGGFAQAGGKYIELLKKNILNYAFTSSTGNLKIKSAKLGNNAGWIGAACLNFK